MEKQILIQTNRKAINMEMWQYEVYKDGMLMDKFNANYCDAKRFKESIVMFDGFPEDIEVKVLPEPFEKAIHDLNPWDKEISYKRTMGSK
jgi:hypothetical protein